MDNPSTARGHFSVSCNACISISIVYPVSDRHFLKRLVSLQANRVSTATRHFVAFKPPGLRFDRLPGALSLCFELPACRNIHDEVRFDFVSSRHASSSTCLRRYNHSTIVDYFHPKSSGRTLSRFVVVFLESSGHRRKFITANFMLLASARSHERNRHTRLFTP
jgi:hypothetical protein